MSSIHAVPSSGQKSVLMVDVLPVQHLDFVMEQTFLPTKSMSEYEKSVEQFHKMNCRTMWKFFVR